MLEDELSISESIRKHSTVGNGISVITATVFIVGEVGGAGILSLAFATAQAGWIGLIMSIFCACCAAIAGICLSDSWLILEERYPRYRHGLTRKPLATIGYHSFGTPMSMALSFLMNTLRIGAATVFIILSSSLIESLLKKWISLNICSYIPIIAIILVVPLWLGSPKHFWPLAYSSMLSTSLGSFCLLCFLIYRISKDGLAQDHTIKGDYFSYLSGFGTFLFAYGGGTAFPNFQNDMKQKQKFSIAVIFGFIGLILLYLPIAGLGFAVYGSHIKENILDNVASGVLVNIIQVCFVVHCLTVVIIIINPVYLDLEEALRIPKNFNWKRCLFRTSLLALNVFIGETFPNFGQILNLIGATNVAITAIILPPILYTKLCWDHKLNMNWKERKVPAHIMVVFVIVIFTGIIGGFSSAYVTIVNWQPLNSACYMKS